VIRRRNVSLHKVFKSSPFSVFNFTHTQNTAVGRPSNSVLPGPSRSVQSVARRERCRRVRCSGKRLFTHHTVLTKIRMSTVVHITPPHTVIDAWFSTPTGRLVSLLLCLKVSSAFHLGTCRTGKELLPLRYAIVAENGDNASFGRVPSKQNDIGNVLKAHLATKKKLSYLEGDSPTPPHYRAHKNRLNVHSAAMLDRSRYFISPVVSTLERVRFNVHGNASIK